MNCINCENKSALMCSECDNMSNYKEKDKND